MSGAGENTYLRGLRVLEIADEKGEYAGRVLAGLGADVVKVEPVGGERTRGYGPFYRDEPNPERSLHYWHYNQGKRSVTLDLDTPSGQDALRVLARAADVVIDARPKGYLGARGVGADELRGENPRLIYARISPFGDEGPWAHFEGSDLVHLALGGVAMNSGYDPDPFGAYDTPPIAPQMWQSYHVAGEYTVMSILAAVYWRQRSGEGQVLSASVHHAVSTSTELDIPHWNVLRQRHYRQTGRHSMPELSPRGLVPTKDGRYLLPYSTYVRTFKGSWPDDIALLRKYGMQEDLDDPKWEDPDYRSENKAHIADVMARLVGRVSWDGELWREMLAAGQPWAPVRRPEENLDDPHWTARGTFADTFYPELDRTFTDVAARWVGDGPQWVAGVRAPLVGEHNEDVRADWTDARGDHEAVSLERTRTETPPSDRVAPHALAGVRVVDLSWMLASAGAGRVLASLGAEVIKVEHSSHPDGMRHTRVVYPQGGRAERDAATRPLDAPVASSLNSGGNFMEINTGKLGLSLDLKSPEGKRILESLIRDADIVTEGFSPGTMKRMGFSYERLRELNPRIIYIQQSGLGELGVYGGAKAFGPTAQAFAGLTEMSGLPAPFPPAGIGYSFLDWFGAYNMATGMLAALVHRDRTGQGCHIDASQVEMGLFLSGTAILDKSANGRAWSRYGNASPYKEAAPHGIYPTSGDDRWIAIAIFTQEQWLSAVAVLGEPEWANDPRFADRSARLRAHSELDALLAHETAGWDGYELMDRLQQAGVPAGVAQDAADRIDDDPQLSFLGWQIDLPQSENGAWPARQHPVRFSATPAHAGGVRDRHGPNYGEDTDDVLSRILGYSAQQISDLRESGVV